MLISKNPEPINTRKGVSNFRERVINFHIAYLCFWSDSSYVEI